MKNIFIDCGYHLGEGLTSFTESLSIINDWEVYAFEPNPHCDIKNKISQHPFHVQGEQKAIWIENGTLSFDCEHNTTTGSPVEGSTSELDGWGSYISCLDSRMKTEEQVHVESIDFSEFINSFRSRECTIYCKMDMEGAEFSVLRKMIQEDTLRIIDHLWVEWHAEVLPTESVDTKWQLHEDISKHTNVNSW